MTSIAEKYTFHKPVGDLVCQQMIAEMEKIGFIKETLSSLPSFEKVDFSLQKDPYTGDENLVGSWLDKNKQRIGNIQFLSDGSFYAEYDVVKPHPRKQKWFVDGITAWGREDAIKTEAKLIPIVQ